MVLIGGYDVLGSGVTPGGLAVPRAGVLRAQPCPVLMLDSRLFGDRTSVTVCLILTWNRSGVEIDSKRCQV